MKRNSGFTLVELVVAASFFAVVTAMSLVALTTTTKLASMSEAQAQVQANLRTAISEMAPELRSAYTDRLVEANLAPESAASIRVSPEGSSVTFQVPVMEEGIVAASTPITYRFENEDAPVGPMGAGNALLDPEEDVNGDGVLTRRIVRAQDGVERIVGLPNEISSVRFTLERNAADGLFTTVLVELEGSKRYAGRSDNEMVRARLETRIRLEN